MPSVSIIEGDLDVRGQGTFRTLYLPTNTVTDAMVNSSAAIAATKVIHQHCKTVSQESATTAADATYTVHSVYAATATMVAFECSCVVANIGDSKVEFDLKKNGSSILSAVVELNSTHTARQIVAGALSSTALVDGDVLEVNINATIGTGTLGKGAFATVVLREAAS